MNQFRETHDGRQDPGGAGLQGNADGSRQHTGRHGQSGQAAAAEGAHDEAVKAYEQNISALAIAAQFISGDGAGWVKIVSVILNIFAVMTAFFGVYLGFREATQGIVMNILRRKMPVEKINEGTVQRGIMLFAILLAWSAIVLNAPVLSFTSICSPIFGMVGCLIPAWLVYKVPALHKYKGVSLVIIVITGLLLCVSPFLAFS